MWYPVLKGSRRDCQESLTIRVQPPETMARWKERTNPLHRAVPSGLLHPHHTHTHFKKGRLQRWVKVVWKNNRTKVCIYSELMLMRNNRAGRDPLMSPLSGGDCRNCSRDQSGCHKRFIGSLLKCWFPANLNHIQLSGTSKFSDKEHTPKSKPYLYSGKKYQITDPKQTALLKGKYEGNAGGQDDKQPNPL